MELKDIMQFVCAHNDALEQRAYQDVDEVLQIIADTARVTPMEIGIHGRGAKMVWGVYIKSPSKISRLTRTGSKLSPPLTTAHLSKVLVSLYSCHHPTNANNMITQLAGPSR